MGAPSCKFVPKSPMCVISGCLTKRNSNSIVLVQLSCLFWEGSCTLFRKESRMKQLKLSLNQQAFARLAQVLVGLIIVAIVGYSEVMFLQIMGKAFPDGFFKIVAMMGGVATGLSVLTLLI